MHARVLLSLALATLGACGAPEIQIAATYGELTPSGDASIVTGGGSASVDNSVEDLGLDQASATPALRADFKWGMPHLTVATQKTGWDGSGTLSEDFGGITVGTDVDSQLDLAMHRAILTFDVFPTDLVEIGLGLGVTLVDVQADVEESGGGASESIDELLPFPVLAARLGARIWRLDCELLVAGLSGTFDGNDVTNLDLDLNAKFAIFGDPGEMNGSVIVGWRQFDLAASFESGGDAVDFDLSFNGPYIGFQLGL